MFPNGRLPTLDTEMWVGVGESGEQKLLYSFYSKPTASPYTIMETSALPQQTKTSSLSQEVVRRMLNISKELKEERKTVVDKFDTKLKDSGYSRQQRRRILEAGLVGGTRKLNSDTKPAHQEAAQSLGTRRQKKLLIHEWFQGKSEGTKVPDQHNIKKKKTMGQTKETKTPDSIIFIPRSPDGDLIKTLRNAEQKLQGIGNIKLRLVEESGASLRQMLTTSNPWKDEPCGKAGCLMCVQKEMGRDKVGPCKNKSVVYQSSCLMCRKEGKRVTYTGETGRGIEERLGEHLRDGANQEEKSHIHQHLSSDHPEMLGEETPGDPKEMLNLFEVKALQTLPKA